MWNIFPLTLLQRPGSRWEKSGVQSLRSEELLVPLQRPDPAGPQPPLPRPHSDHPESYPGAGHHPWYGKDRDMNSMTGWSQ